MFLTQKHIIHKQNYLVYSYRILVFKIQLIKGPVDVESATPLSICKQGHGHLRNLIYAKLKTYKNLVKVLFMIPIIDIFYGN